MSEPQDTPRARQFVCLNGSADVISGHWLDKDRRRVSGPPETWVMLRYRFDNGREITLRLNDLASLKQAGIEPVWWQWQRAVPNANAPIFSQPQGVSDE